MNNTGFQFLTDEQARQLIREELESFFSDVSTFPNKENQQNQVVDLDGLLSARPYIGSRSTLYKKISKGLIPHSKQGKKLYFDLNEIDAWLMEHKIKSISDLKQDVADYNHNRKGR